MLDLKNIITHSDQRFKLEIDKAMSAKDVDHARINRRRNEVYSVRLLRACLKFPQDLEIDEKMYSLCVAIPELFFSRMFLLGWNKTRNLESEKNYPELLYQYFSFFNDNTALLPDYALTIFQKIHTSKINKSLICHGLSPTSDTILLLADLGRGFRITHSLGIPNVNVLLADLSWIKHNRSINQRFTKKGFLNELRICLDKRERIYKALKIDYKVFEINDFKESSKNDINKTELINHARNFRKLAETLWGKQSLEGHTPEIKKLIATEFHTLSHKDLERLPSSILTLLSFNRNKSENPAVALENSLKNELEILRQISELFSSFDEDIFIYYFAQFLAQRQYDNFIKIAPKSEMKFDQPFVKYTTNFDQVAISSNGNNINVPPNKKYKKPIIKQPFSETAYIYCPQYQLGKYYLLPYTSISGDVLKKDIPVQDFLNSTILLDDSYESNLEKIIGVITQTPVHSRNRLMSDLFSFLHVLVDRLPHTFLTEIKTDLKDISQDISFQIFSKYDSPKKYDVIFTEWMKAISSDENVIPFHLIPYLWEEVDWDVNKIQHCSSFIFKLIAFVNEICE